MDFALSKKFPSIFHRNAASGANEASSFGIVHISECYLYGPLIEKRLAIYRLSE
jgi:hypothetical protein